MNQIRRCQTLCGTFFEVEVSSFLKNENDLLELTNIAFEKARLIEKTFSPFDPDSELSRYNKRNSPEEFKASTLLSSALSKAQYLFLETNGLFNPYEEDKKKLNLNGFIKGFIVDAILESLKLAGTIDQVLVNGGGDMAYWFNPAYSAAIKTPEVHIRDLKNPELFETIRLTEACAVATSARYPFEYQHAKNHSIQFVDKSVKQDEYFSATVVASSCLLADALTKVLVQDFKQAKACAKKWSAKLYYKSIEKELCFEPLKI